MYSAHLDWLQPGVMWSPRTHNHAECNMLSPRTHQLCSGTTSSIKRQNIFPRNISKFWKYMFQSISDHFLKNLIFWKFYTTSTIFHWKIYFFFRLSPNFRIACFRPFLTLFGKKSFFDFFYISFKIFSLKKNSKKVRNCLKHVKNKFQKKVSAIIPGGSTSGPHGAHSIVHRDICYGPFDRPYNGD